VCSVVWNNLKSIGFDKTKCTKKTGQFLLSLSVWHFMYLWFNFKLFKFWNSLFRTTSWCRISEVSKGKANCQSTTKSVAFIRMPTRQVGKFFCFQPQQCSVTQFVSQLHSYCKWLVQFSNVFFCKNIVYFADTLSVRVFFHCLYLFSLVLFSHIFYCFLSFVSVSPSLRCQYASCVCHTAACGKQISN
jgi:hypothetical protein